MSVIGCISQRCKKHSANRNLWRSSEHLRKHSQECFKAAGAGTAEVMICSNQLYCNFGFISINHEALAARNNNKKKRFPHKYCKKYTHMPQLDEKLVKEEGEAALDLSRHAELQMRNT